MIKRVALVALLGAVLVPAIGHAKENAGGSGAAAPVAPTTPLLPPGSCLDHLDCSNKCGEHANVHTSGGADATLVARCKTACNTQSLPGHPGQYMANCVRKGAKDLKCVQSLVTLNLCLFQAAANPVKSAKCTAAAIPGCR